MNSFCDVIIPIYNAYDATVECIESVIKNTNFTKDRLILVNDCSPDERISVHINSIKAQYPKLNIVVIENEENKGFVGTVNVGMRYSKNDVLLLNSDTVVGKNWLDKIKNCAYSQPKVGTVTAMSNNATLVSVPQGLMRNEVPNDITIDEYNDILSECSYRDYPALPTAHGFCLYIRREALDTIGLFDEESFGRGYGEENDFSYRCMDYGFKNLMCDDVIVYHLESQSFSEEREKVLESHLKIIEERYPDYFKNIDNWCKAFPIDYICKNINYNLNLRKKKNVLVVIHEWDNVIGGTTIHVKDIVSSLSEFFNFHVLFPNGEGYVVESYFGKEILRITMPFKMGITAKYNRFNSEYGKMIDHIVRAYAIDAVHIHHMSGHFFDIADVTTKYNINSVITLHDFYSLCPSVNMLYCNEKYCGDMTEKNCAECLIKCNRASNNIIPEWQSEWNKFLRKFSKIIVPSEDTKAKLAKTFNDVEITVIEHGVENSKADIVPAIDGKLRVAFIGVMCRHKGSDIIRDLIKTCKKVEFHTFGKSEFSDLKKNKSNYIFHGPYKREELSKLLWKNRINIICFMQIWPETYSYTVNEAVSAGVPVLSLDIGAGAERVKKYNLGWVLPRDSTPEEIADKLIQINKNVSEYNTAVENVKKYVFKSVAEMAEEYRNIYDDPNNAVRVVDCDALKYLIKEEKDLYSSGYVSSNAVYVLNEIMNSTKWKLISMLKVPRFISRPAKVILRLIKKLIKR